ncbi:MAG: hypothetical protein AABY26_05770, partial [Nanoarchaeota archaeon]
MIPSTLIKLIYLFWPPVLRVLEKIGVHNERQDYHLGSLNENVSIIEVNDYLVKKGFEKAILSWKDPGEILNLRKIDKDIYQYHLRIFDDGEIRAHYEYSSEGRPFSHISAKVFSPEKEYFYDLM